MVPLSPSPFERLPDESQHSGGYNMGYPGDQAVLQCSAHGGDWCCDHNRNASNVCCDSTDSNDFFPLPQGISVASISTTGPAVASANIIGNPGNGAAASSQTTSTSTSSSTSTTPTSTSSTSTTSTSTSSTSTTPTSTSTSASTSTSTTKNAASQSPTSLVSVISIVSVVTSAGNNNPITTTNMISQTVPPTPLPTSSQSPPPTHHAAEIGGAVGGAFALIAILSLASLLLHRRKKKQRYHSAPTAAGAGFDPERKSIDYMYKAADMMGSPHNAGNSPEIDGTPIVGVYRGWGPGGEGVGALRVVNGEDQRRSVGSAVSELESPTSTTPRRAGPGGGFRGVGPTIEELPAELEGRRVGGRG
ncbi:MAG: hypothetical protein Q9161_006980 [Pseudevernia consocians]